MADTPLPWSLTHPVALPDDWLWYHYLISGTWLNNGLDRSININININANIKIVLYLKFCF